MLLIRNLTGTTLLKVLSHDIVSNINKCSLQCISIRCRHSLGYLILHPNKYSNKNNNLNTLNCKAITKSFSLESSPSLSTTLELTAIQFEKISDETLESLTEYFDELIEEAGHLPDADVSYGDGVLTVKFGNPYGTYVINRQTPNKQIWLSSPSSGPKRYDFINGKWIYKHDGKTLHELLNNEVPAIIRNQTNFNKCSYSGREREAAMNDLCN